MDGLVRFLSENPSLAVALTLGCVAVTAALVSLIATLWVRPKMANIDDLRDRMTKLETKHGSLPDFTALLALVNKIDGALQAENKARSAVIEDTIKRLESLHSRSKAELERMVTAQAIDFALEQAGQDVELAQSMELISRLGDSDRRKEAEGRLERAQKRLRQLEEMQKKATHISSAS
jgi:hypothetical protein